MTVAQSTIPASPSRLTAPVTTRDVLHRAADLIEEFEWRRFNGGVPGHGCFDAQKGFCVLGAVSQALIDYGHGHDNWQVLAYDRAMRWLPEPPVEDPMPGAGWWRWNDDPGTTKDMVVNRLREAAEAA